MRGMCKSQSAMEYLMTYGWTILAIAIVMVSLYSLGIFNLQSLAPTATPGSCQVIRTAAQTSLAGQCNNMIPKYAGKFNGQNSYVGVNGMTFGTGAPFTVLVWANVMNNATYRGIVSKTAGNLPAPFDVYVISQTNQISYLVGNGNSNQGISTASGTVVFNTWQQWAFVYTGIAMSVYRNGVLISGPTTVSVLVADTGQPLKIGNRNDGVTKMYGSIANVQIYNTSLDNTTIKRLYQEGIGGAPVDLQHLVGWWPLNGDANDYSGSFRNGMPANVTWNANWQSGYAAPTT
ncbi:MAG: LamG domain-containing protein [Candidatus Micrarchaeota archaeon]|nr:LamG domain-containing protein [Candidatus Micrarchaeota archaeon]